MTRRPHVDPRYPLSALTAAIIAAAHEVHRTLGRGFREVVYQRALARELTTQDLEYSREVEIDVFYEGHTLTSSSGTPRETSWSRPRPKAPSKTWTSSGHCPISRPRAIVSAYCSTLGARRWASSASRTDSSPTREGGQPLEGSARSAGVSFQ
jgi:hypothetical protein